MSVLSIKDLHVAIGDKEILKGIKDLSDEQKKQVGPMANELKEKAITLSEAKKALLAQFQ